jgi:hypothetical protein
VCSSDAFGEAFGGLGVDFEWALSEQKQNAPMEEKQKIKTITE